MCRWPTKAFTSMMEEKRWQVAGNFFPHKIGKNGTTFPHKIGKSSLIFPHKIGKLFGGYPLKAYLCSKSQSKIIYTLYEKETL